LNLGGHPRARRTPGVVEAEFEQVGRPASDRAVKVAPGVDVDPGRWSGLPVWREAGRLD